MNIWLIASLWVGLALISAMVSIRLGISVALVEIGVGVLAGNFLHLAPNDWERQGKRQGNLWLWTNFMREGSRQSGRCLTLPWTGWS